MKFKADVVRGAAMACAAALLLAACGGGTQVQAFAPGRVVAFGDESSRIESDGRKYTVNSAVFDHTMSPPSPFMPDCAVNPIWIQQVAASFGLAFPECPGTATNPRSVIKATLHATSADLKLQVDAFVSGDTFAANDLVTVMVGTNDIVKAVTSAGGDPTANPTALYAIAAQAGADVGTQVVRITDAGAKALVATIPNVGFTPYAAKLELDHPGSIAVLTEMSVQFNDNLRLGLQRVANGGHAVGLVLVDEAIRAMVLNPLPYGLTNLNAGACNVAPSPSSPPPPPPLLPLDALTNCSVATLSPAALLAADGITPSTAYAADWLWADDTHLGAAGQGQIGALAVTRGHGNPF